MTEPLFDPARTVAKLDEVRAQMSDIASDLDGWDAAPAQALRDAKDMVAAVQDLIESLAAVTEEHT